MINLIRNEITQTKKKKKSIDNPVTFRPTRKIRSYLAGICNTTNFVNRAIDFYINLINDPEKIMIELKKRNPDLWKHINRKKFQ